MKRLFVVITLLAAFILMSFGATFTVDKITYTTLTDNEVAVTGFNYSMIEVTIPSTVTYNNVEYKVTRINDKGLYGNKNSQKSKVQILTISEGVEWIGKNGVQRNSSLKTISLPSTLTYIGEQAFDGLTALERVTFPNGSTLKTISKEAFDGCTKLENINFYPESDIYIGVRPTFPKSLETIGNQAFKSVPAFKNIILHGNLAKISDYAFYECPNLEYVWIQEGIEQVGQYAFYNVPLTYVVLPASMTSVQNGAFTWAWANGKNTRTTSRTYILLGETPFKYSPRVQTEFYNLWLPANIDAIEGDKFYVKESAIDVYIDAWKNGIISSFIDYKIPFDGELNFSTNYREFDTDFTVAANSGNKPFVAVGYGNDYVQFRSIDSNIVPAETGIVIRKNSNNDTWYQIAEEQGHTIDETNFLKGVTYSNIVTPTTTTGEVNYVLNNGIFCTFNNSGYLGDHKAYLQLPSSTINQAKEFIFESSTTNIDDIRANTDQNNIYNLNGMKVQNPKNGVYIINNKKVIIKK